MAASTEDSIRAFIALPLDPALAAEIKKVQHDLNSPGDAVRWIRPEQLHLTLRFLGNVAADRLDDLAAALRRACARAAPIRLALEGAGCFPSTKSPRVIWIGIQGDLGSLQALQERIAQETKPFGDHSDERPFQPHLTIGRVKGFGMEARKVARAVQRANVSKLGALTVRHVLLIRSKLSQDGARYSTLAEVPLDY
jgi:2'-5' RNA ligase